MDNADIKIQMLEAKLKRAESALVDASKMVSYMASNQPDVRLVMWGRNKAYGVIKTALDDIRSVSR